MRSAFAAADATISALLRNWAEKKQSWMDFDVIRSAADLDGRPAAAVIVGVVGQPESVTPRRHAAAAAAAGPSRRPDRFAAGLRRLLPVPEPARSRFSSSSSLAVTIVGSIFGARRDDIVRDTDQYKALLDSGRPARCRFRTPAAPICFLRRHTASKVSMENEFLS
jgi:hypothetical protein